jgi:hypothetical protein
MPQAFNTLVKGNVEVKRVPPEKSPARPAPMAAAGSIDGTMPGKFWINLRDRPCTRASACPTSAYHEGSRATSGRANIPTSCRWSARCWPSTPIRKAGRSTPSSSPTSWASMTTIRWSQLGYLQSHRLPRLPPGGRHRASTPSAGPASRRSTGSSPPTARPARKCGRGRPLLLLAGPGLRLQGRPQRDQPPARPGQGDAGPRYDFKAFNDAVVLGGNVPMTVLGHIVDRHVAARKA